MPLRVEALVGAGRLADPRTIPDLIALAGHPEVALREAATFALGMTGDRRALSPLLHALDDRRDSVQTLACLGLAHVGDRRATRPIIAVVSDTRRPVETRAACAFALGLLGDRTATAPLGKVLTEGNGELQRLAAWALGRLGDRRALPALLTAYFETQGRVRDAVTWALPRVAAGKSGGADPVRYLDYPMKNDKLDLEAAVSRLAPETGDVQLASALLIGHDADLAAGIRAALSRHRDAVVRVLEDLDARPLHLALGPLTAHLAQATTGQKAQIGAALARIGRAILPDLEKLADHRDPVVRERTLSVLGKIATPAARPLIEKALADPDLAVREAAMRATASYLGNRGTGAAKLAAVVAAQLASPRWQVRVAAARALGDFGPAADRAGLTRAARGDAKAFVREAAVTSLGRTGGPGAVAALREAADASHEKVPDVRAAAATALALAGGRLPRVRTTLAGIAQHDPSPVVRAAARRALAQSEKK